MTYKKIITIFAIAVLIFMIPAFAENKGRYYVNSDNSLLKFALGVRHEFKDKFSTDLNPIEVSRLKNLGFNVEEVPVFSVDNNGRALGKPSKSTSRTCTPSTQMPWGILKVNGGMGGFGVNVAVLDTGVKKDHFDLKANIKLCVDATKIGIRNGCSDGNGHGTHVAGTVAANGGSDGNGVFGIAPQAGLIAVKVCGNSGFCFEDDIAKGIKYASDNGASIISMSLGGSSMSSVFKDAIDYAVANDVLVVAAAGNSGPNDNTINYPGAYYKVVAVGATDSNDNIAGFSSRGNNYATTAYSVEDRDVEFAAPGVSVESTWNDGCYRTISGTSMATPHVSGLAAKVWQGSADATRTYLQNLARYNYTDIGRAGDDPDAGFGLPRSN